MGTDIDLRNLNHKMLNWLAARKPMDVHKMRENLRSQIINVGTNTKTPQLVTWALSLSPIALDYLVHLGFTESIFWESLTSKNLEEVDHGEVKFLTETENASSNMPPTKSGADAKSQTGQQISGGQTCPTCGNPTTEKGSCKACLPYNIYAGEAVRALFDFETLRKLVLANLAILRRIDFQVAQLSPGGIQTVQATLEGRVLYLVPNIDSAGREAVLIVFDNKIIDGMHRGHF